MGALVRVSQGHALAKAPRERGAQRAATPLARSRTVARAIWVFHVGVFRVSSMSVVSFDAVAVYCSYSYYTRTDDA